VNTTSPRRRSPRSRKYVVGPSLFAGMQAAGSNGQA
jgi:hypothetical protein